MSCERIRSQLSAYLDGELADEKGSVVRGHLRGCTECRAAAGDEAVLRDGLRVLPSLEPPATLWVSVQQRLAEEEVADAERPAWRRAIARWIPRAPQLALGGAVLAAAVVLVVVRGRESGDAERTVSAPTKIAPVVFAPQAAEPAAPGPVLKDSVASTAPDEDVSETLARAPGRISDEYATVVRELEPLAREARARWTADQQRDFDSRLVALQGDITSARGDRARQRSYRTLIRYLQRAAIRDDVALASVGGTR